MRKSLGKKAQEVIDNHEMYEDLKENLREHFCEMMALELPTLMGNPDYDEAIKQVREILRRVATEGWKIDRKSKKE